MTQSDTRRGSKFTFEHSRGTNLSTVTLLPQGTAIRQLGGEQIERRG
jgi:hypothetical protein